jgi:nucleotide-binding universal stress UspA family protein
MILLETILVATDFSQPSEVALAYGRELARTFHSRLVVAHVVENILARAYGGDGFVFSVPDVQWNLETSARHRVDALLDDEDRDILRAESVILVSNAPAAAIGEYAAANDIDLIVLGTQGRGAVAHLLTGSVAERVVRAAPCPVLTVRHPEREFVVEDGQPPVSPPVSPQES